MLCMPIARNLVECRFRILLLKILLTFVIRNRRVALEWNWFCGGRRLFDYANSNPNPNPTPAGNQPLKLCRGERDNKWIG